MFDRGGWLAYIHLPTGKSFDKPVALPLVTLTRDTSGPSVTSPVCQRWGISGYHLGHIGDDLTRVHGETSGRSMSWTPGSPQTMISLLTFGASSTLKALAVHGRHARCH